LKRNPFPAVLNNRLVEHTYPKRSLDVTLCQTTSESNELLDALLTQARQTREDTHLLSIEDMNTSLDRDFASPPTPRTQAQPVKDNPIGQKGPVFWRPRRVHSLTLTFTVSSYSAVLRHATTSTIHRNTPPPSPSLCASLHRLEFTPVSLHGFLSDCLFLILTALCVVCLADS